MGKKQKEEIPNVNATTNRDIVQRLNFLYQASVYLQSIAPSEPSTDKPSKGKERDNTTDAMDCDKEENKRELVASQSEPCKKARRKVHKKRTDDLARTYVQCMRVVGQKTTVKIDPSIKRTICSGCHTTLIPGASALVRVKKSSSQGHFIVQTCLHCRTSRRIPAPPNNFETESSEQSEPVIPTDKTTNLDDTSSAIGNMASSSEPQTTGQSKKKRRPYPRKLPLFAWTDAGHVVFRGNERLLQE
ncbi:Rpr2-domain-containing protein [Agrocybe pediades]|nr:Rpr2-domain-containing protein [Agrocybe pediades]